jgi:hypothetical protein
LEREGKIADAKNSQTGYAARYYRSVVERLFERDSIMKLRMLFLAAIAFVVLAGSVVPANAKSHHHHRHHGHHHRS